MPETIRFFQEGQRGAAPLVTGEWINFEVGELRLVAAGDRLIFEVGERRRLAAGEWLIFEFGGAAPLAVADWLILVVGQRRRWLPETGRFLRWGSGAALLSETN